MKNNSIRTSGDETFIIYKGTLIKSFNSTERE